MNMKGAIARKPWILAAMVFSLVCAWMFSGLFAEREVTGENTQIAASGDADAPMKVQVQRLYAEPVARTVSVYGRTAPARIITISAEAEGKVETINARRGERLRAGQPILTLDLRDREARVNQAAASVKEHETAFKAQSTLQADGYVSATQIAETLAKLEAAKAELVRAKLDLNNRVVRAPFTGVLQERDVEIGDFVRSGDPLATFVDNETLIVTGTLAEQDVAEISVGDTATAKLVTGQSVSGAVRYISPVAEESTRTFLVELEIANPDGKLPAGVTAEMNLIGGEVLAHRVSPALLTLDTEGQIGVMTVDERDIAKFMPVAIEKSASDGVWVSGLNEAAQVIVVGQGYVRSGQPVNAIMAETDTALAAESMP